MIDDDVFATETAVQCRETTEDLEEERDLTELMEATTFRSTLLGPTICAAHYTIGSLRHHGGFWAGV